MPELSFKKDSMRSPSRGPGQGARGKSQIGFSRHPGCFQGMREFRGEGWSISPSVAAQTGGFPPPYVAWGEPVLGPYTLICRAACKGWRCGDPVAPALNRDRYALGDQGGPGRIQVGRFGKVEEVADVVLMLAQNGYISGQTINVSGGLSIGASTLCSL